MKFQELMQYDDGYGVLILKPSILKLDLFSGYWRYYLELGIAYLEGKITKKIIPDMMSERLENIQKLIDNRVIDEEEIKVQVHIIEEENSIKRLDYIDGSHRTILALSKLKLEDRYVSEPKPIPIKELINWLRRKSLG